jgi:hypothetical protein
MYGESFVMDGIRGRFFRGGIRAFDFPKLSLFIFCKL